MKMRSKVLILLILVCLLITSFSLSYAAENEINSINWDNNTLTINTDNKIIYTEARLKDPDRLIVDILDCNIDRKTNPNNLSTRQGEIISIAESNSGNVRIVFLGSASINRTVSLTNNDRTLFVKNVRIGTEQAEELISENAEQTPLENAGEIQEITVEEENDKTWITISANKSIRFNTYQLKNPERLIIDLLNILPPKETLPYLEKTALVNSIRIGSAANGIEATRIVIDFSKDNIDSDVSSTLLGNKLKIELNPKAKISEDSKNNTAIKIVIDPGHGGYDSGASYGGHEEKDINFSVSTKLKDFLENQGITVFLTREDDSFISLAERNDITNSIKPDVFVSIHANALKTSNAIRGLETYYWTLQSEKLAYLIHKGILSTIEIPDHYIRKARFYVVKFTESPAILIEMGFVTNSADRKLLTNETIQDKYAKAIGASILKFLNIGVKTEVTEKQKEE